MYVEEAFSWKEDTLLFGNLEDKSEGLSSSWMVIYSKTMCFVLLSFQILYRFEPITDPAMAVVLPSAMDLQAKSTCKPKDALCQQFLFLLFDFAVIPGTIAHFSFLHHFQDRSCFCTKFVLYQTWKGSVVRLLADSFCQISPTWSTLTSFPSYSFCQHFCTHPTSAPT